MCGGFSNKRESCIYDSVYYLRREKNDQKHPQHHVFLGECFSSSVRMYVFLYGNMTLVVFSKQHTGIDVGYRTKKCPLPVTPLTVSVRVFFAFIFGNLIVLPVM